MAFRIEKRTCALAAVVILSTQAFAQNLRYEVLQWHSRPLYMGKGSNQGVLSISETGVSFEETAIKGKKPKQPVIWKWDYQDIQQLTITPTALTVLTYKDNKWKFGADREYRFTLASPTKNFQDANAILRGRLDQRFVSAIPDKPGDTLWQLPVKRLAAMGGDEGTLAISSTEIVYTSAKKDESRTWRYDDIDNISSSGPFSLEITTFERARMHYGSLKAFNFELKQPLGEASYNDLWLQLNRSKGLKVLNSYSEASGR